MSVTRRCLLVSTGHAVAGGMLRQGERRPAVATGPGPRTGHVLTYHGARRRVVLLGGYSRPGPLRERIWTLDGRGWVAAPDEPCSPGARSLGVAGYDTRRRVTVVFGGIGAVHASRYGDLWEHDGDRWTERSFDDGPGPRDHHAAAFDEARGRLVVYGGNDADRQYVTDTWEWDGTRWERLAVPGPGGRAHHACAYDSRRQRLVLLGGFGSDGVYRPETWEWDGKTWERVAADGPRPRARHRLAFDGKRGVTLLFGGDAGNPGRRRFEMLGDTWLWDGRAWTDARPSESPSPRFVHAMAYDADLERIALYGGGTGTEAFDDTWAWNGASWSRIG